MSCCILWLWNMNLMRIRSRRSCSSIYSYSFPCLFVFGWIISIILTAWIVQGFFRTLAVWIIPCFLLKTAREVARAIYVHPDPWWHSVVIVVILLVSWTYLTMIFLSGAAVFNLVCNLQVTHFESYGKLLERDLDVSIYIEEHIRLTHYLSKISHRFRIFLLLVFLGVTASLLVALLQTTGNKGILNLINGGDFGVSLELNF